LGDLPTFDAAHYLDSETGIAVYLTDILEANDAAWRAAASIVADKNECHSARNVSR